MATHGSEELRRAARVLGECAHELGLDPARMAPLHEERTAVAEDTDPSPAALWRPRSTSPAPGPERRGRLAPRAAPADATPADAAPGVFDFERERQQLRDVRAA